MRLKFRPTLDGLETRETPAVSANLTAGILAIQGDNSNNSISVSQSSGRVWVSGTSPSGNFAQNYAQTSVSQLVVLGEQGNDTITLAWGVTIPARLFGNSGNDLIYGGSGNDIIYGGDGSDTIYGRPGNDTIFGGPAFDTISDTIGVNSLYQGSPFRGQTMNATELAVLTLVNQARASNGLAPLAASTQLAFAARTHSLNMATRAIAVGNNAAMQHTLYGTTTPTNTSRVDLAGYDNWTWLGENIAYGFGSAQAVFDAWMNSPGHRANILNGNFTEIGISLVTSSAGTPFWTQAFGSRV